ncbi:hypothetical protein AWB83_07003 [Caballeronia ptereochthonis]|uniref:Uncharacterized protein n=1 Tax=Caballeronia ptereochthonis TaxID=1777144 RepID=A0A158ED21_9BURK|nr:hypothetical protein AWB83_07003 [Caballeronia ptereochthonis]
MPLVWLIVVFSSQWWSAFLVTDCDVFDCTASTRILLPAAICALPPAAMVAPCTVRSWPAPITMSPVEAIVPCAPTSVCWTRLPPATELTPAASTSVVFTITEEEFFNC